MTITGLSMAAHAHALDHRAEADKVLRMLPLKYPEAPPLPVKMPSPDEIADGHFRTRLLQGLRAYGSGHLLIALSWPPVICDSGASFGGWLANGRI
jgi:hypothetical protein